MGVKSQHFLLDFEMIQEFVRNSGVFSKNKWRFLQDTERAKGDIFEVSNWGRDEDQSGHSLSKNRAHHFFNFGARDDFYLVFVTFDAFRVLGYNYFFVA